MPVTATDMWALTRRYTAVRVSVLLIELANLATQSFADMIDKRLIRWYKCACLLVVPIFWQAHLLCTNWLTVDVTDIRLFGTQPKQQRKTGTNERKLLIFHRIKGEDIKIVTVEAVVHYV